MPLANGPVDWGAVQLVVFDVDGTLYDQRSLRLRMLALMLKHVLAKRSLDVPRILRIYRILREIAAEETSNVCGSTQYDATAFRLGCESARVEAVVQEWMERRPLPILASCKLRGINDVFDAACRQRKRVGILSDYPAHDKLAVLGLTADFVVTAADRDITYLKPHPAGLRKLLELANVGPENTIMIGDRVERDWAVADKLGIRALIRSRKSIPHVDTFVTYQDPLFADLLVWSG